MSERQFNVRLPDKTHKLIALLQAQYGLSQARLIESLIEQAAAFAKLEVAQHTMPLTDQVSATEIDSPDEHDAEVFTRQKGAIDHIGP